MRSTEKMRAASLAYFARMSEPDQLAKRFWSRVDKTDGCWLWTGAKSTAGYGSITVHTVQTYAHRLSYEWAHGPIAPGLVIDHLCANPSCIRPDHLEAVTQQENIQRAWERRGTCRRGHPRTPETLWIFPSGQRRCRICHQEWKDRRRAA